MATVHAARVTKTGRCFHLLHSTRDEWRPNNSWILRIGKLPTVCVREGQRGALAETTDFHEAKHGDLYSQTAVGQYLTVVEAVRRRPISGQAAADISMSADLVGGQQGFSGGG
jgi:hypothetical protein